MNGLTISTTVNGSPKASWSARFRLFFSTALGLAIFYLILITLAEVITTLYEPRLGLVLHGIILIGILLHATLGSRGKQQAFLLAQSLAPLVRILSLSLPLRMFPLVFWYAIVGMPLFIAALLTARIVGLGRNQIGLTTKALPLQIIIALTGIGLGYLEYIILRPPPLSSGFSLQEIWLPATILLIFTGFLEEIIFRGIMYYVSLRSLGRIGIFYVAGIFAVLHIGYKSFLDIIFVFSVAVIFGLMVIRTGSILGVTLAHGFTNIGLFLIFPFILGSVSKSPTLLPDQAFAQQTIEAKSNLYSAPFTLTPSSTATFTQMATATSTSTRFTSTLSFSPTSSPTQTPSATRTQPPTITLTKTSIPSPTISKTIPPGTIFTSPPTPTRQAIPATSITQMLPATSTLTPVPGVILIDDGDPGFSNENGNQYVSDFGFGGDYIWSSTTNQKANVEIVWAPQLSSCGKYQVDVFIPSGINLTQSAFYQVGYRKGMAGRLVNQSAYAGQWVTIGVYEFLPTSGSYLRLNNRTGEPAEKELAIVFDAARWVLIGPCLEENP